MSKVFLCGDPHGEFDHILSAIDQWHPDAVLILGDLTPSHSLDEIFKGVKRNQDLLDSGQSRH